MSLRKIKDALITSGGFLIILILAINNNASAYTFNQNNIIDDVVFNDSSSMSAAQIDAFLNSFPSSCISTNNGFSSPNVTGYNPSQGFLYGSNVSAGTIISNATKAYDLNPRVILATLQKEQSLVTGGAGCHPETPPLLDPCPEKPYGNVNPCITGCQYSGGCIYIAMGYDCPYYCAPRSIGFSTQIVKAAWKLKFVQQRSLGNYNWNIQKPGWDNSDDPQTAYDGYMTQGYLKRNSWSNPAPFDGYRPLNSNSITVHLDNGATTSLYSYTPFLSGGQSFFNHYTNWFGSTVGAAYAWTIEDFTYSGGDNIILPGETETLTLKARNVGRFPWYNHGDNPVRLGTWEPAGRTSSLFGASKLTTVKESVVLPNEVGTFEFTVTPSNTGTFEESLNLVAENSQWAQWPGFRPTILVPPAYQWQIQNVIYEKGTGVMDPGTTQLITLIAKNTGSATWSKSTGPPIRLGTWQPQRESSVGQGWQSTTRVVDMNEATVAPGQTAGYQFYVRMPSSGVFYEKLNLVAEGQAWFNDNGLTLYLFGNDFAWNVQNISYSAGTGVMTPGSTQTITVQAKNTGTATWYKNGGYPIRLGTWQPQRISNVAENWLSSTRMANLTEVSVAPGQTGTFTAQVRMPATGTYYERMNLVAEGLKWLNDPGLTFYLEGRNP